METGEPCDTVSQSPGERLSSVPKTALRTISGLKEYQRRHSNTLVDVTAAPATRKTSTLLLVGLVQLTW